MPHYIKKTLLKGSVNQKIFTLVRATFCNYNKTRNMTNSCAACDPWRLLFTLLHLHKCEILSGWLEIVYSNNVNTHQQVLRAQTKRNNHPFQLYQWYETNFT